MNTLSRILIWLNRSVFCLTLLYSKVKGDSDKINLYLENWSIVAAAAAMCVRWRSKKNSKTLDFTDVALLKLQFRRPQDKTTNQHLSRQQHHYHHQNRGKHWDINTRTSASTTTKDRERKIRGNTLRTEINALHSAQQLLWLKSWWKLS